MQLMRQGDAQAFEVIYERHAHAAFSLAYRMTGRRGAAEDVVQEAFLSLWRSGARYDRTRGSVRTWVLGIVHNRAIDSLRRNLRHDTRRASDEGIEERFEAKERTDLQAAHSEEAAEVRSALDDAARGAEQGDRACLLRRLLPFGDRHHVGDADRDREGTHPPRAREAPRDSSAISWRCRHDRRLPPPRRRRAVGARRARRRRTRAPSPCTWSPARSAACEVAELQVVADVLPMAAPQLVPPPALKSRIMERRGVRGAAAARRGPRG